MSGSKSTPMGFLSNMVLIIAAASSVDAQQSPCNSIWLSRACHIVQKPASGTRLGQHNTEKSSRRGGRTRME